MHRFIHSLVSIQDMHTAMWINMHIETRKLWEAMPSALETLFQELGNAG